MNKGSHCFQPATTRRQGSTLIEAMLSILIMSIGMTALFSLYINNTLNSAHSHHVATALTYARSKIEILRFENNAAAAATTSGNEHLEHQQINYQRSWKIIKNNRLDYHEVYVSMMWQDSSGHHQISLNTLITDSSTDNLFFDPL